VSEAWDRELSRLLSNQRAALGRLQMRVMFQKSAAEKLFNTLTQLEEELRELSDQFDASTIRLWERQDDPEVVVRNYNRTTINTYHADTDCGWVKTPSRTERILLSEAHELGYYACYSCGYRVPKPEAVKAS
jgi:hypothetical protein